MPLLTLRTAGGIVLYGVSMEKAAELLTTVGHPYSTAVTWGCLAGAGLSVSADQLHTAIRRFFSCEEVLCRASGALASLGFSRLVTETAQQRLTQAALLDTWPAAIEEATRLCAIARRAHPAVATEQGLLWIIANALEDPWTTAAEPLTDEAAQRRFARFTMIASGVTTIPTHLVPAVTPVPAPPDSEGTHGAERKPRFTTARTLLTAGRLVEYDDIVRWPVRTIELYGELLTEVNPSYAQLFEQARGMTFHTWVIKVCSLAHFVWKKIADGELKFPVLDVSSPGPNADNPILRVIRALSTTRDSFVTLMRECRTQAADPTLAFQPMRQYPLLDVGDSRYVVLHKDFLLAAADDGIWYELNDSAASRVNSVASSAQHLKGT